MKGLRKCIDNVIHFENIARNPLGGLFSASHISLEHLYFPLYICSL